jgi:hypothetical protein
MLVLETREETHFALGCFLGSRGRLASANFVVGSDPNSERKEKVWFFDNNATVKLISNLIHGIAVAP